MRTIDPIILAGLTGMVILMVQGMKSLWYARLPPETVDRVVVPLSVLGLSTLLYTGFSMLYPPFILNEVIIQGLTLGFVSSGVYGIGKTMLESAPKPQEQPPVQ